MSLIGEVFPTNATILRFGHRQASPKPHLRKGLDSIELVDDTMNFLRSEYGDELTIQTASDQQGDDIAQSIDTIGGNADLGAMAALFASLLVVGFIMVIITKERVNEIGVLKAIGLPNSKIVTQFLSESIFMASLGFVVCILITLVAGPMKQTSSLNQVQMMHHQQKKNQLHKVSTWPNSQSYARVSSMDFSVDGREHSYDFGLTILIGIIGALYYWGH